MNTAGISDDSYISAIISELSKIGLTIEQLREWEYSDVYSDYSDSEDAIDYIGVGNSDTINSEALMRSFEQLFSEIRPEFMGISTPNRISTEDDVTDTGGPSNSYTDDGTPNSMRNSRISLGNLPMNSRRASIPPIDLLLDLADSDYDSLDELYDDLCDTPKVLNFETLEKLKKKMVSYSEIRKKLKVKHYEDDCTICLSPIKPKYGEYRVKKYILLNCKHVFHCDCIFPYLEKYGDACPNCREDVS